MSAGQLPDGVHDYPVPTHGDLARSGRLVPLRRCRGQTCTVNQNYIRNYITAIAGTQLTQIYHYDTTITVSVS